MNTYVVFGLGLMGGAICIDLLQHDPSSKVHGIEISEERINNLSGRFDEDRLELHNLKLGSNDSEILDLLKVADVAFGAIDYEFNEKLTRMCIKSRTNFLDLGGNPTVVKKQQYLHSDATSAGIIVVPDCGLAPGLANILAAELIRRFDDPDECHIRVGGLPQNPKTILNYQQVFSIRGLINEYIEDAIVIRDKKILKIPSLTEIETLTFPEPFNQMEAFQTAGGTSSLPELFEGKINQLTYKTIRYPGHVKFFKFLKEFGMLGEENIPILKEDMNPRKISEYLLQKRLPQNDLDVVLIRIFCCGKIDGNYTKIQLQCIDEFDREAQLSAMARTTAFPISIIGQMIANNKIQLKGVQAGEVCVPALHFKSELAKRKIIIGESLE